VQEHQCVDGSVQDTEMWVDIKGYEGRYQISNLGRVKSLARMRRGKNGSEVPVPEIIMALTPKKDTGRTKPYVEVRLRDGGIRTKPCKSFLVHRLVAGAFIKPLEKGEQVDHINGVHADNRVSNLRVMHYTEHAKIHPMLATEQAKKEFQQLAQQAIAAKRATGWKPGQYDHKAASLKRWNCK
jgi:NUMOD4 motif/HNH endonuclease